MLKRSVSNTLNVKKIAKYDTFSSHISSARLRHVQELTKKLQSKQSFDAILCIQGIDSRYNAGSQQLIDYLLFDFHASCRKGLNGNDFSDEILDDLIIMVAPYHVYVYCNPKLYMYVLPFISHWRNLSIHCLTDEEYEDSNMADDFKIRSLLEMLNGRQYIGIPFTSEGLEKSETMSLEKWPIIQAVGLEEYGPGGFFTMNFSAVKTLQLFGTKMHPLEPIKIIDVSDDLLDLYIQMDPVYLEILMKTELPQFEQQWASMISLIDATEPESRNQIIKEVVEEPLKTYYNHGLLGKVKQYRYLTPFLHFGKTSVKESLHSSFKACYSVPLTLKTCGVGGNNAPFLVCQAVAPTSPVSCSRTFFFCSGQSSTKISDIWTTRAIYNQMVEGTLTAIDTYVQTCDIDEAAEAAMRMMSNINENLPVLIRKHMRTKDIIKITLEAFDRYGRKHDMSNGIRVPFVKVATMVVYDIPSIEVQGTVLGTLVFSEAFIESTIDVYSPDVPTPTVNIEYVVLTDQVPRIVHWNLESVDPSLFPNEQPPLYNDVVYLKVMDSINSVAFQGTMSCYDIGIALGLPSCGDILIPWTGIESVLVYQEGITDVCVVIIDHYTKVFPLGLYDNNTSSQLIVFLHPKTKAFRTFSSQVLPLWRNTISCLGFITGLTGNLERMYLEQSHLCKMKHDPLPGIRGRSNWPSILKKFMTHYEVSMCSSSRVEDHLLPILLNQPSTSESLISKKIPVTIISGIPGSFKDNLASSVTKYTEETNRWIMFNQRLDSASQFIPSVIHNALSSAVSSVKQKRHSSMRKLRILVITPGFTDVVNVVQAILTHPDAEIRSTVAIGSVTCCIDPCNAFLSQRLTFPVLLNHCQRGWVNNIVLSSAKEDLDYAFIRHLIRTANSSVSIFVANQGEITRSSELDSILSTNAFNHDSMVRARYLSIPSWMDGLPDVPLYPPMNEVILRFKPLLDRQTLIQEIKALHKKSYGKVLTGNIYHIRGRTSFYDSDDVIELQFTTKSNVLTWTNLEPQGAEAEAPVCFFIFTGCQLEDTKLKDWLRKCTKMKYTKKPSKTIENLTETEIQTIHKENHLSSLPDGWFYNGHSFVNISGEKTDVHPDMPEFLKTYVKEVNREIAKYNKEIDENNSNDIFL